MIVIECPACGEKTYLSLDQPAYHGPFRCWKCRGTFMVQIENEEMKSIEPISEDEFESYDN